jgi:uncharacterized membrane protein
MADVKGRSPKAPPRNGGGDSDEDAEARTGGEERAEQGSGPLGGLGERAKDVAGGVTDQARGAAESVKDLGDKKGLVSELRSTVGDAAMEVLRPIAKEATTSATKYAAQKGPELLKERLVPKIQDVGGAKAVGEMAASKVGDVGGGLVSKVTERFGRKGTEGTGRGRRLPVQESIDIAVPVETAYDQYTQFEEFPRFMHRVEKVEQRDDTHLMWQENIWGVRRQFEVEIVEQTPNERIEWRSTGGPKVVGVVTFHELADRLTRIYMTVDWQPQGLFEKTASGTRMSRRALKSDLMRLKAFLEMHEEETGAWRGRIEEGEVVEQPEGEEREQPEAEEGEQPEAEEREEPEAEEGEEPEAEEGEEPEGEYEEEYDEEAEEPEREEEPQAEAGEQEEEPEEQPVRRRPPSRAGSGRQASRGQEGDRPQRTGARRRPSTRTSQRSER